ncbi:hypothetical protein EW146_g850 [Bondarzewia mesenterica]|uniref:Cyclopropane-fatty-acyl-phospholipid synthase n=1 Tax=Bondarzewia mesenterica TaxID=1095465 RepID=A0A4S4M5R0_9AGAM|nr:hypothetical protein EW146_g850 [Bondarzewia mesenterica]
MKVLSTCSTHVDQVQERSQQSALAAPPVLASELEVGIFGCESRGTQRGSAEPVVVVVDVHVVASLSSKFVQSSSSTTSTCRDVEAHRRSRGTIVATSVSEPIPSDPQDFTQILGGTSAFLLTLPGSVLRTMSSQLLDTPFQHRFSFSALADNTFTYIKEKAFKTGFLPISRLAEAAVVSVLQKVTKGQLRIITRNHTYEFPPPGSINSDDSSGVKAELRVVSDTFWVRLAAMGDLGFSEAYMYGEVDCDDLIPVFLIFIYNRENLQNLDSSFSWLFSLPQRLTSYRFLNTLSNSRSNISAHYDLSNDMFTAFLSQDMTYSCAIFPDLDGDLQSHHSSFVKSVRNLTKHLPSPPLSSGSPSPSASPPSTPFHESGDELYEAQILKLQHITKKARILPGHHVLEIGSGWGALALHILQSISDTQIDTLTLSMHQHSYITRLIKLNRLEDRVRVHLMDYREMPTEWAGKFDRVVSIEMLENVGKENFATYWSSIDRVMKKKTAVGVVQVITLPEGLFPGGFLPSLMNLHETITSATEGRFLVDSISNIGPHYARTLREWRWRFVNNFDMIEKALHREHPGSFEGENGQLELKVFWRKWIYYFCYCEVGFTTRLINNHIITFTREGNKDMACDTFI